VSRWRTCLSSEDVSETAVLVECVTAKVTDV
jgi:hypothetical protein